MQVIFVGILHEVNKVRIVVLNRVAGSQNVLTAHRSIFLLLFQHFSLHFTRCIIVGNLWLKLYDCGRCLSRWLFDQVRRRHRPMVKAYIGVRAILFIAVIARVVILLVRVM